MSCFTGAGYTENKISMLLTPGDFAEHVTETSWMLKRGVPMKKFTKKEIFSIPNIMGYFRILLIPVFCYLYITAESEREYLYAAFVVLISSLTDLFDGKIARKYNLVTNFGKFMDPLADKLLVCSALICLIQLGQLPAWVVIIIISREFIISGFRLVAADNGIVIAASYWGKFKTTFQMIAVILMIFNIPALATVTMIMLVIAVVLTVISLVDYVAKNIEVLTKGGM